MTDEIEDDEVSAEQVQPATTQPERKPNPLKRGWGWMMGRPLAALLIGLIAGLAIGAGASSTKTNTTAALTPSSALSVDQPPTPETPVTDEPAQSYTPSASEFHLTLKILKKQCFGSAGCNVSYRVDVAYTGPALDPSQTWEVTYEVLGGEDGSQVNTLKVTGDQAERQEEESISTSTTRVRLSVRATDVALV